LLRAILLWDLGEDQNCAQFALKAVKAPKTELNRAVGEHYAQEILIQEANGTIRIFDFAYNRFNSTLRVSIPQFGIGGEPVQLLTTPDGSMLVCLEHDPDQGWLLTSYILEGAGAKSILSIVRDHQPLPAQLRTLSAVSILTIHLWL
jgi:hypothetical protein